MIKFKYNPTQSTRITSRFGARKHPVTGKQTMHNGIDIGALQARKDGDPLISVADGTVIVSKVNNGGVSKGYGYYLVIQHDGFATLYGHMQSLSKFKVGDKVKAGTEIGKMGSTGTSTSTHLHFGLTEGEYKNMKWIDPEKYLLKGDNMELTQAIKILKEKVGLSDETIQYLENYKYGEELIKKLARSIGG